MNMRIFILFSVIIPVFFVSGCGGGETKTDVESTDLLVIKDIVAIPSAELKPSSTVVVRMEVQNVGQTDVWMLVDDDSHADESCYGDDGEPVDRDCFDGDMALVNYCKGLYTQTKFDVVSKAKEGMVCGTPGDNYLVELSGRYIGSSSGCYLKFAPQQIHIFQWTIRAPAEDEIGRLTNECEFNFQTIYTGRAKTLTYVYFAAPQEVAQRIYTGNDLTLVGDNIASYGPVLANFETGEKQPITAGVRDGTRDVWTVYLNFKNLGGGIAKIRDVCMGFDRNSGILRALTGKDLKSIVMNCELDTTLTSTGVDHYCLDKANIESQLDFYYKENLRYCNIEECKKEKFEVCDDDYKECEEEAKDDCEEACEEQCEEEEEKEECIKNCEHGCIDGLSIICKSQKSLCILKEASGCESEYEDIPAEKLESKYEQCDDYGGCDFLDDYNKIICEFTLARKDKLEIYKTESSRLSCSMTVPDDVVIMQPYKFVTTAYYAYSLGRDFKIKTNPYN